MHSEKKDVCSASIIDLNAKHTSYIHLLGHFSYLPQEYSVLMDIMMVMRWKFICHDAKKQKTQHQKKWDPNKW